MPKNWQFVYKFSRREFVRSLVLLFSSQFSTFKLCFLSAVPLPKYSIGQRVFITWFDADNQLEVVEPGTIVGLAFGQEFFPDVFLGWYYFVQLDSCPTEFLSNCFQSEFEVFPL
jgi:hypothetical protein